MRLRKDRFRLWWSASLIETRAQWTRLFAVALFCGWVWGVAFGIAVANKILADHYSLNPPPYRPTVMFYQGG